MNVRRQGCVRFVTRSGLSVVMMKGQSYAGYTRMRVLAAGVVAVQRSLPEHREPPTRVSWKVQHIGTSAPTTSMPFAKHVEIGRGNLLITNSYRIRKAQVLKSDHVLQWQRSRRDEGSKASKGRSEDLQCSQVDTDDGTYLICSRAQSWCFAATLAQLAGLASGGIRAWMLVPSQPYERRVRCSGRMLGAR